MKLFKKTISENKTNPDYMKKGLYDRTKGHEVLSNNSRNNETDRHFQEKEDNDSRKDTVPGILYQCPMKCEGDKTYDQPGNCPVCNMKLAPIR